MMKDTQQPTRCHACKGLGFHLGKKPFKKLLMNYKENEVKALKDALQNHECNICHGVGILFYPHWNTLEEQAEYLIKMMRIITLNYSSVRGFIDDSKRRRYDDFKKRL